MLYTCTKCGYKKEIAIHQIVLTAPLPCDKCGATEYTLDSEFSAKAAEIRGSGRLGG